MRQVEVGSVGYNNLARLYDHLWGGELVEVGQRVEGETEYRDVLTLGDVEIHHFFTLNKEGKEEAYVRYTRDNGTLTFRLNEKWTQYLFNDEIFTIPEEIVEGMGRVSIEFPSSWLQVAAKHPADDVLQDDLKTTDKLVIKLSNKLRHAVDVITKKSNHLVEWVGKRDHDLYLTFKTKKDDLSYFTVRFDKVYPEVPKEGITLGEGETLEIDNPDDRQEVKDLIKTIGELEHQVNRQIQYYRKHADLTNAGKALFEQEVRTLLFAASHFSKRIYPFNSVHGKEWLDKAANEILERLYAYKATTDVPFGLDVNSWFVWSYPLDGSEPVKVTDESVDFIECVLNRYTESFVDILTGFLMDLNHTEVIRPYHYVVPADLSDGYSIGSIRRVK